ncbi:hypothetical protein [Desulfovibrio sp. SGI.169]|uniref:hypothetical protein n=1 Tax=Desulfovibrio sp. SGI.169 TaxID=3420561 RepID=UPI003D01458B
MIITLLDGEFSICQIHDLKYIDFTDDFVFVGKTDQELSLVCRSATAPDDAPAEKTAGGPFALQARWPFP